MPCRGCPFISFRGASPSKLREAFIGDSQFPKLLQEGIEAGSVDGFEAFALKFAQCAPERFTRAAVHLEICGEGAF